MKDFTMPSPKELAKKEATRPISIRVKERTMLTFEKLAKQYDTTASFMINNLLDSYVATLDTPSEKRDISNARKVMSQYLEKLAVKVGASSDEDLFVALARDKNGFANADEIEFEDYMYALRHPLDECDYTPTVDMWDDLNTSLLLDDKNSEARLEEDDYGDGIAKTIFVPRNKYPVVANMFLGYLIKNEHLYEKRTQKIDEKTIEKIVETINSTDDRIKLAKGVGKLLSQFDGVQDGR